MREAIFDVLSHLDAVVGAQVLDAFAGSGALGIEALSRGAAAVTFVEADRAVAADLRKNLEVLGDATTPVARVVIGDALRFLAGRPAHYDLALVDPPYAFEDWGPLLEDLDAEVVVCESDRPIALPAHLVLHRHYRYGTTLVTVARAPVPRGRAAMVGAAEQKAQGAAREARP